ncbi:MAG: hypothetical protein AVO35_08420 [Candidatus Aegiribacteria sp. MLS_C]|nr:MAG: hypothetical protein AVO35_08420 [Candidatus Aegiribacteria sp. MLS_C]
MADMKQNIDERKLAPEHIFAATMIAGISSFGILNQAVMAAAARQIGKDLAEYHAATRGGKAVSGGSVDEVLNASLEELQSLLQITDSVKTERDGDVIYLKINANKCRYCPKGVGRAELSGTLCPFPTLVEEFVNALNGRKVVTTLKERGVALLTKEEGWCITRYTEGG